MNNYRVISYHPGVRIAPGELLTLHQFVKMLLMLQTCLVVQGARNLRTVGKK